MTGEDDVYELLETVLSACAALPEQPLSGAERMAKSGHLFREAPELVRLVARLLADRPDLYDDVPIDPAALRARQDRAQSLGRLSTGLALLQRRAADLALSEQAQAIEDAMAVVRQVRGDATRPFPHPQHVERADAVRPALELLAGRHPRKRRPRPAAPGAAQQQAMKRHRRAQTGAKLDRWREELSISPADARADGRAAKKGAKIPGNRAR